MSPPLPTEQELSVALLVLDDAISDNQSECRRLLLLLGAAAGDTALWHAERARQLQHVRDWLLAVELAQ